MIFLSKYIDLRDTDQPIQKFYQTNFHVILSTFFEEFAYPIKANEYTFNDDVYDLGNSESGRFYTIQKPEFPTTDLIHDDLVFKKIIFKLDNEYDDYERSVLTLFEVIGIVGGVYEIIYLIFKFIVPIFSVRIFHYYLVSRLNKGMLEIAQPKNTSRVHNYSVIEDRKSNLTRSSKQTKSSVDERMKPKLSDAFRNMI